MIRLTPLEEVGVTHLPPDIVWGGFVGDLSLTADGSLVAEDPIRTAAVMLLFTDARCLPEDLRFEHGSDRRGYPGDGVDVDESRGEAELGSRLWLYRRAPLNDGTALQVADEARRALEPLIAQGIARSVETSAEAEKAEGRIRLAVSIIGRDGRRIVSETYDLLWSRT